MKSLTRLSPVAACSVLLNLAVLNAAAGELGFTVEDRSPEAFGHPLPGLGEDELRRFAFGNRLFETGWVAAPGSVATLDGLGPLYNRVSCSGCHVRDGRGGAPSSPAEPLTSMLLRVVVQGQDAHGGPAAHPRYGLQIQDRAIQGFTPEARIAVEWIERDGRYPDGASYALREPRVTLSELSHGPLGDGVGLSLRVAPSIFGAGLLEAVDESALEELADEEDEDGDGVSGRLNRVRHPGRPHLAPGRFGWKATEPTVRHQVARALAGDIGITSSEFPATDPASEQVLAAHIDGGHPEISEEFLERLVFYVQNLAVPARRGAGDPAVRSGERLFSSVGCASCHAPALPLGEHPIARGRARGTIAPYTDLLLHDLGPGLADGASEFDATGSEWRTPPLWGIGLVRTVNRHTTFLHDGRARTLEEAILWHGGEAERARTAFERLGRSDRLTLLAFLRSL